MVILSRDKAIETSLAIVSEVQFVDHTISFPMKTYILYFFLLLLVSACEDTPERQSMSSNPTSGSCSDSPATSVDASNGVANPRLSDDTLGCKKVQKDSLADKKGEKSLQKVPECSPLTVLVVADSTRIDSVNTVWVGYSDGEIKVGNGYEEDSICIMTLTDSCRIVLKAQQDTVVACCDKGIVLKSLQAEIFLPASFKDEVVVQPSEPDYYSKIALVELGLIILLLAIILTSFIRGKNKKKGLCPRAEKRKTDTGDKVAQQLSVEALDAKD